MRRLSVTFEDEQFQWLTEQSEQQNRSKAEILRQLVDAARSGEVITGDHQTTDDEITTIHQRLDELEQRLEDIEGERERTPAQTAPADRRDESPAQEQERAHGPLTDAHESALDEAVESWDDEPERLQQRREAARAVLEYAVESGRYIGKTEATERFLPAYSVPEQNPETWWRKNIRPVLGELGEYSRGHGGYRIES